MAVPPIPAAHLTRIWNDLIRPPASTRIMRMTFDPKFAICTQIIANLRPKVAILYTDFGTTS